MFGDTPTHHDEKEDIKIESCTCVMVQLLLPKESIKIFRLNTITVQKLRLKLV